jgi:hypothetical protein
VILCIFSGFEVDLGRLPIPNWTVPVYFPTIPFFVQDAHFGELKTLESLCLLLHIALHCAPRRSWRPLSFPTLRSGSIRPATSETL